MPNFILLYNPYYQSDVIESHVNMLISSANALEAKTAFGKIRSKLRNYDDPLTEKYQSIYAGVSDDAPLQLFLTDYSSMYVARVIGVTSEDCYSIAPSYYRDKNLEVEHWFVINDIRRIAHKDFELVRDTILPNLTTPHFGNHRYAIYGNQYVYPMQVEMINAIDYFSYEESSHYRYFTDIFKSESYHEMKKRLVDYRFGELFYALHPNSQDAIVSAEIEYAENSEDSLYDYSSVVVKFSKALELEIYLFLRQVFKHLMLKQSTLQDIAYSVQSRNFTLKDYMTEKPNLGTNKFLLKNELVQEAINSHIQSSPLRFFLFSRVGKSINAIQEIRNEAAHGQSTAQKECQKVRNSVLGIGENGTLCDLLIHTKILSDLEKSH
jgi:hypothetical protein